MERGTELSIKPYAFRPTEKAEQIIITYMQEHNLQKPSDAIIEIIETSLSLSKKETEASTEKLEQPSPIQQEPFIKEGSYIVTPLGRIMHTNNPCNYCCANPFWENNESA